MFAFLAIGIRLQRMGTRTRGMPERYSSVAFLLQALGYALWDVPHLITDEACLLARCARRSSARCFARRAAGRSRSSSGNTLQLVDRLAKEVTRDPSALEWFAEEWADQRISRAYRELLAGYEIDPASILKATRMLEPNERPGQSGACQLWPNIKPTLGAACPGEEIDRA
jgi:hypothetical protein